MTETQSPRPPVDDRGRMKAIIVATAAIAFVLSPVVSQSFGGFEPDQFPIPQDHPPAQPAGYAFAIWSLIYAWLVAHAGFGLLKRADAADWDATRWPLAISLVIGAAWIPTAQQSVLTATVLIWLMLGTAVWAYLKAPARDYWWAKVPLGLYAGWLTAASWVSVALVGAGWGIGPGALAWAWIVLVLALLFAAAVLTRAGRAPEYGAAVAWAAVGIAVANFGSQTLLAIAALLGAVGILALSLLARN